jgi:hypothetical protein
MQFSAAIVIAVIAGMASLTAVNALPALDRLGTSDHGCIS